MFKPNHLKALALLRENAGSIKEIAHVCNITPGYLYDLVEGAPHTGQVGYLFSQEYKKIKAECSKRTHNNLVTLKDRLVADLLEWNASLPEGKNCTMQQAMAKKNILAEINKSSGGLEIGELHLHSGLSGEDLINEFKRVRSQVDYAALGSRVPKSVADRAGALPIPLAGKAKGAKGKKASSVSPESEAGEVSPE